MYVDTEVLLQIYDLAEMINQSEEAAEFLKNKEVVEKDLQIIRLKEILAKEKKQFEEVKRFGQYHPDYQEIKSKLDQTLLIIEQNENIQKFKKAENRLDDLLYQVAHILGQSISKSIKIGRNDAEEQNGCAIGSCSSCSLSGNCII